MDAEPDLPFVDELEEMVGTTINLAVDFQDWTPLSKRMEHGKREREQYRNRMGLAHFNVRRSATRSVSIADDPITFFVKYGPRMRVNAAFESEIASKRQRGFRTPAFVGRFESGGYEVGVWEAIDLQRRAEPFSQIDSAEQMRMIRAIAALNTTRIAFPLPAVHDPFSRDLGWFVSQSDAAGRSSEAWRKSLDDVRRLFDAKDGLMRKMGPAGEGFLTHNDLGFGGLNAFIPNKGDVIIFDFENPRLSRLGADLSIIAFLGKRRQELFRYYVDCIRSAGRAVQPQNLALNIDLFAGFRTLTRGWRAGSLPIARLGQRLLDRHIRS